MPAKAGNFPLMKRDPKLVMASAFVHVTAQVGEGTLVGHFALVREYATIGANCKVGSYTEVCPGAVIGDDVRIHSRCFIVDSAVIGRGAFLGPGVILCDAKYPRSPGIKNNLKPPMIGENAVIGAGAVILPGVNIGAGSIVGAGSVVTKNIPEGAVAYGNPCRVHNKRRPKAYLESLSR